MSILEKLNTIKTSLSNIKTAIINKGQTPSGNITTYADAISNISGGGQIINNQDITITSNGIYSADTGYTGLGEVSVNVAGGSTLGTKTITSNGIYPALSDSLDGYSSVTVNVSGGGGSDQLGIDLIQGTLTGDITLDSSITKINDYAFAYQTGMTGLTAPNVTSIGSNVFYGEIGGPNPSTVPQITNINLPNYVGLTLDETTGELVAPQGSRGVNYEGRAFLGSSFANLQSINIPNLTIIPNEWYVNGSPTINFGNIIGVGYQGTGAANSLNINPLSLKYCEEAIQNFNNNNFDGTNLDQYAVNGVLSFDNLLTGSRVLENYFITSASTIDKISFPVLKKFTDYNLIGWLSSEKDITIEFPNQTSIGDFFDNPPMMWTQRVLTRYCNNNQPGGKITLNFPACTAIGQCTLANYGNIHKINAPNCTTLGTYVYSRILEWANVDEVDLSGVTSIVGNVAIDFCTIGLLDLSSLQDAVSLSFNNSTITTLNLSSCQSLGNSLDSVTGITNLLLGGNSVVFYNGVQVANITNIYVPDNLVSAYEADSYWSQYPQGTIKPLSQWTNVQAS